MSPLWSDMALARAAWAKADEHESGGAKAKPLDESARAPAMRPVRRVHRSWQSSSFAL